MSVKEYHIFEANATPMKCHKGNHKVEQNIVQQHVNSKISKMSIKISKFNEINKIH